MIEEIEKCYNSIEYFANNYIKINTPSGIENIVLNDFQKSVIKNFEDDNKISEIVPRQIGKTTVAAIILLHQAFFNTDKVTVIFGPKILHSNEILEMMKIMYHYLPDFLKSGLNLESRKTALHFSNGCTIYSAGSSLDHLRGRNVSYIYIDEHHFMPKYFHEELRSLYLPVSRNTKVMELSTYG